MVVHRKSIQAVAITASLGTTPAIAFDGVQAQVILAAAATLTFYGCDTIDGTYRAIKRRSSSDTDWTAFENATLTAGAAGVFPVPDQVLCMPFIKIVGAASATITLAILGQ